MTILSYDTLKLFICYFHYGSIRRDLHMTTLSEAVANTINRSSKKETGISSALVVPVYAGLFKK